MKILDAAQEQAVSKSSAGKGIFHRNFIPFLRIFLFIKIFFTGKMGNKSICHSQLLQKTHGKIITGKKKIKKEQEISKTQEIQIIQETQTIQKTSKEQDNQAIQEIQEIELIP